MHKLSVPTLLRYSGLAFACLNLLACSFFIKEESLVEKADKARSEARFERAIELYRQHMTNRLASNWRQDWENPHFYLLAIGDTHLENEDPIKALQNFELALRQGVGEKLVADRILSLSRWYEERHELEDAVRLLQEHKNLDELLFNAVIDRLNKQIILEEQAEQDYEQWQEESDSEILVEEENPAIETKLPEE